MRTPDRQSVGNHLLLRSVLPLWHRNDLRRDPLKLAREVFDAMIAEAGLSADDIGYIATTGEAETLAFATGHFYSMTTHARDGVHLDADARAVLNVGALCIVLAELETLSSSPLPSGNLSGCA